MSHLEKHTEEVNQASQLRQYVQETGNHLAQLGTLDLCPFYVCGFGGLSEVSPPHQGTLVAVSHAPKGGKIAFLHKIRFCVC